MKTTVPLTPEIVSALFCTDDEYHEFEKQSNKRVGLKVRKLHLCTISIDLRRNFNDNINFIKQNISPVYSQLFNTIPMRKFIEKRLWNKNKMFSYMNIDWNNPPFPLSEKSLPNTTYLGLTPLFLDMKWRYAYDGNLMNQQERNRFDSLMDLRSYKYKPIMPFRVHINSKKWKKGLKGLKKKGDYYEI